MARNVDWRRINPEHSVAANSVSPNGETRMWHFHNQVLPKPPIQIRPFRVHSSAESAILLMSNSTGVSVQPQNIGSATNPPVATGGGELIFPEQMLPDEWQGNCQQC